MTKKTIHKSYSCWLLALFTLCFSVSALDINNQTFSGPVNTQAAEQINVNNSTFDSTTTGEVRSATKIVLNVGTTVANGANMRFTVAPLSIYDVTFTAGPNGLVNNAPSETQNITYGGSTTPVSAKGNVGYHFVNWTDTANNITYTDNPLLLINVQSARSITANFNINQYTVNFSAINGTISGTATQTVNHGASTSSVTAVPNTGYIFYKWSDNHTNATRTINPVVNNASLTAIFIPDNGSGYQPTGSFFSQTFDHSNFNRRTSQSYHNGANWSYGYDDNGNLDSAVKTVDTDAAQNKSYTYTYDEIGNRLTTNEAGVAKTYTPNDLNQYDAITGVTGPIDYDLDGNPLKHGDWDLTWNLDNQLTSMYNPLTYTTIEFKYDYRGFRVRKKVTINGIVDKHIAFLYDGNLVSAEIDILNPTQRKIIRKYTWGLDPAGTRQEVGGIGALVGFETYTYDGANNITGTNKYHVVSDAGGNVVQVYLSNADDTLTLVNEYEYGPFGQIISKVEGVEMPYQYQTKYTDGETGLVYYGKRYFDCANGRWLSQDPLGIDGGINLYNAVSNNMVNGFSGGQIFLDGFDIDIAILIESFGVDISGYGRGRRGPSIASQLSSIRQQTALARARVREALKRLNKARRKRNLPEEVEPSVISGSRDNVKSARGLRDFYRRLADRLEHEANLWEHGINPQCLNFYSNIFEARLKPGTNHRSDGNHFSQANSQLYNQMRNNPEFARQLEAMYPGITQHVTPGPRGGFERTPPPGTTWHHVPSQPGTLHLTPRPQHQQSGNIQNVLHPGGQGGRAVWGGGRTRPN